MSQSTKFAGSDADEQTRLAADAPMAVVVTDQDGFVIGVNTYPSPKAAERAMQAVAAEDDGKSDCQMVPLGAITNTEYAASGAAVNSALS